MSGPRHITRYLVSTAALFAHPALAQQGPAAAASAVEEPATNEIVVTAQKRNERLNDVPLSITAATGAQLQSRGINSPSDLAKISPGFSYQNTALGVPVYTLRGIGLYDNFFGVSPPVTVYVDQVPIPYLAMTRGAGLDVERVEVLKGPQGTLFGQNSTGGAINYIAAKPTRSFEGGFDLTYGRFNEVDSQVFLSGPLTDTLSARAVVRHEYRGDWQYSLSRPGDGLGQKDYTAARLLLDWDPREGVAFELNVNAWWDRSDTQAGQFYSFNAANPAGDPAAISAIGDLPRAPENPRAADWTPGDDYRRNDQFKQISLRGDIDIFEGFTLTSLTSYIDFKIFDPADIDGTAYRAFLATQIGSVKSFFQELRVSGNISDRIKLTVGGNYQRDNLKGDFRSYIQATNDVAGPITFHSFDQIANQKANAIAGFAALDYKITNSLTLQGSGRYTHQNRDFDGCFRDGGDGLVSAAGAFLQSLTGVIQSPAPPGGCITLDATTLQRPDTIREKLPEHNVSWRGSLNWKANRDTLLYANVTKGYKTGAFTAQPAFTSDQLRGVPQESVKAYEIGFKTSVANRRVDFTGALFYYDYRNKQLLLNVPTIFGPQSALRNVPKSSVKGAELSVILHPVNGLILNVGGTYVDSKVKTAPPGTIDALGNPINIEGQPFPNTPKWQAVGDAQYDFPLSGNISGFVGGGVTYRSSSYALFGRTPGFELNSYALVDVRAGFDLQKEKLRVELWGRNLTNKYYVLGAEHANDTTERLTGIGATYGVTLSARFF